MMKTLLLGMCLFVTLFASAQAVQGYQVLDTKQPIVFSGDRITYKGQTIPLGPRAFFIDGQLPDSVVSKYPFVFNSVNKAAEHLTHGTESSPMVLYLAPYVYWIDDPDDPSIRVPKEGSTPYGLIINCEWLKFQGLTDNAENVVLASNRGQTIGAQGNFTMFKFIGQGTSSENITFGNYCNVDLVFPLKPQLSRPKRASAIVQAQLIHCNGDKIVARNTRFISRLNLCPFVGGKRVLFDRCHFESTDDALCGTGVYLNATLDFYSSKPFYNTTGTGAVFLNCDIRSFVSDRQYFTKARGQVAVVDCRFTSPTKTYWGWQDVVPAETRNYQSNVTLNGKPLFIGKQDPASTVDLLGKPLINAYRFVHKGKVVYNTYNLLRGDDDWDPMGIKPVVLEAEKAAKQSYTNLAVQLLVSPTGVSIETKKNKVQLKATMMRFGNYVFRGEKMQWAVDAKDRSLVQLQVSDDGSICTVVPANTNDDTRRVVVRAFTSSGLEGASVITVAPPMLEAPEFSMMPTISLTKNGMLHANYKLDMTYNDQSDVRWYRCTDASGSNAIEVAVSRFNTPLREYVLSAGDIGYYLMVSVAPKHIRSKAGKAVHYVMQKPIAENDVKTAANVLTTDFKSVSTKNQPKVIPGFWTWDYLELKDSDSKNTTDKSRDAWYYGEGSDGAANLWGLLQGRSASMRYTPVGETFGNMKLIMTVAPLKTAGQGFSVAHLYMDVLIKFDAKTKSGYALRFIRTTKYHDAVDCVLLKYKNGIAVPISEPISTTAFRTFCTMTVEVKDNKLKAHVTTSAQEEGESKRDGVLKEVNLESKIEPNVFGGFGIEYNGGSPTLIKEVSVQWK
ncbi:MAG: hypothetical protein ICV81_01870 [Flavisolibacter sp.]|nr:hypothetical protein [Flavisolibacter sp.]